MPAVTASAPARPAAAARPATTTAGATASARRQPTRAGPLRSTTRAATSPAAPLGDKENGQHPPSPRGDRALPDKPIEIIVSLHDEQLGAALLLLDGLDTVLFCHGGSIAQDVAAPILRDALTRSSG